MPRAMQGSAMGSGRAGDSRADWHAMKPWSSPSSLVASGPPDFYSGARHTWPTPANLASSTLDVRVHFLRCLRTLDGIECIGERNFLDPRRFRIRHQARIDEKRHRHLDRLPGLQRLLLEAEALDLAEVEAR